MLEWFLIGFLTGTVAMLPVWPEKQTLYGWLWNTIRKRRK